MNCSRHILTTVTTIGGFIPLLLFSAGTFGHRLLYWLVALAFGNIVVVIYTCHCDWLGAQETQEPPIAVGNGVFSAKKVNDGCLQIP